MDQPSPQCFLEGQAAFSCTKVSNNRSVMPLDVRGCTRATLKGSACKIPCPRGLGNPIKTFRDWDRRLQLFSLNEEFPVSVGHQLALITSLPFVHTARRCPELSRFEKNRDCWMVAFGLPPGGNCFNRYGLNRAKVVTRFP